MLEANTYCLVILICIGIVQGDNIDGPVHGTNNKSKAPPLVLQSLFMAKKLTRKLYMQYLYIIIMKKDYS